MNEEEIERAVLAFLSTDSDSLQTYRSLTAIYEELVTSLRERGAFGDEYQVHNDDDDKEALRSVLDQMVLDDLLEAKIAERDYERSYRLTDQGGYEASIDNAPLVYSDVRPDDAVSSSQLSEPTLTAHPPQDSGAKSRGMFDPAVFDPNHFDTGEDDSQNAVKSESWTGSQLGYVDIGVVRKLRVQVKELHTLAYRVNYESAEDEQDLKRLADALLALSDMAAPDVSLIVRILAHPKFKIYTGLFAAAATIRGALGI